ncbi:response regulator transcription factor [Paraclostridium sordellii]|uniref:response regulator transcription factor n=1 Tax=Paraclostridium sordellii TaxID=1505 RepID=UPI0005E131CC|nr:response regulator transcription factor [Paeniclostridium sordellii]CEN24003.1 winged helix family two component transcriptional regulator [[Clostridium] sordellii] [Paeniclostridium sordellii]
MGEKILIVEDEKSITEILQIYLENENYEVHKCFSAEEALKCIESMKFDLAILDVMLPMQDGFYLCKKIRGKYSYPIIMLTAKNDETSKITGLTFGADDYITKPFLPLELVARVKAQLRRYKKYNFLDKEEVESCIFTSAGLELNSKTRECNLNGTPLSLTPSEFSILSILMEHKGEVVSSGELFRLVWNDEYYSKNNNTVTVHIRHLREKLGDKPENPKYIKTVWGVGYKIV